MKKEFIAQKAKDLHVSEKAVIRLVELAMTETEEQLPLLQKAVEKTDYNEIQSISHRIKGYLLNLKFDELGAMAQEMNLMSLAKEEIQAIKEKYGQLLTCFEALRKDMAHE